MRGGGHTVELASDAFPRLDEDAVYVVIPHEFHAWGDPQGFPDASQRARTIALCTENPGTEWFEQTCELVAGSRPRCRSIARARRSSGAEEVSRSGC